MDNLADDKKPPIFENFAGRIRQVDRALDPITKAKLFRQAYCAVAHRNHTTGTADFLDNVTAVMRYDLLLHRRDNVRRTKVHLLARSCATGNQVRAHVVMVILRAAKNLGSLCPASGKTNARDVSLRST